MWGGIHTFFFVLQNWKIFFEKSAGKFIPIDIVFFICMYMILKGFLAAGNRFWAWSLASTRKTWLKNVRNLFVMLAVKLFPKNLLGFHLLWRDFLRKWRYTSLQAWLFRFAKVYRCKSFGVLMLFRMNCSMVRKTESGQVMPAKWILKIYL